MHHSMQSVDLKLSDPNELLSTKQKINLQQQQAEKSRLSLIIVMELSDQGVRQPSEGINQLV